MRATTWMLLYGLLIGQFYGGKFCSTLSGTQIELRVAPQLRLNSVRTRVNGLLGKSIEIKNLINLIGTLG